jgi:hypothetical protein
MPSSLFSFRGRKFRRLFSLIYAPGAFSRYDVIVISNYCVKYTVVLSKRKPAQQDTLGNSLSEYMKLWMSSLEAVLPGGKPAAVVIYKYAHLMGI